MCIERTASKEALLNKSLCNFLKLNSFYFLWNFAAHNLKNQNFFCFTNLCFFLSLLFKFYFQISYKNSTVEVPHLLQLPGCPEVCTLDDFERLIQPLIPTDWHQECKVGILETLFSFYSNQIFGKLCNFSDKHLNFYETFWKTFATVLNRNIWQKIYSKLTIPWESYMIILL